MDDAAEIDPSDDRLVGSGNDGGIRPIKVEAREGFKIWIEYADGASGVLDFSHLADKPAFTGWGERRYFESVHIDDYGAVEWGDDLQMCPDSVYMQLTGAPLERVWPNHRPATTRV